MAANNKKDDEKAERVNKMADAIKAPSGKLRSLHITPAENGYTVETAREEAAEKSGKKTDDGGDIPAPSGYQQPKSHVFPDKAGVMAHVEKHL